MAEWSVVIHVLSGFWLVTGLLGRGLTQLRVRREERIDVFVALTDLAGAFERVMVIPGSFAVLVAGLLAGWAKEWPLAGKGSWWLLSSIVLFLSLVPVIAFVFAPRGRIFESALTDARALGRVTPGLMAAARDPVVAIAHVYEVAVMAAIVTLMVVKPF